MTGSGGISRDITAEVLAEWHRAGDERERQLREAQASGGAPPLAVRRNRDGTTVAYRPRDVIVAQRDVERVLDDLRRAGADKPVDECGGTLRYRLAPEVDVLAFVDRVVERCAMPTDEPAERPPAIGPNHVFASQQHYQWGPGGEPSPDQGEVEVGACQGPGEGATIGVLDTGVWGRWKEHDVLRERLVRVDDPQDLDPLVDGSPLVRDAGHGTFIAGIIAQRAPGARIDPEATLDRFGLVDEFQVALDLPDLEDVDILTMSFAGHTHDDRAPVAFADLLDRIPERIEVVAAAGNDGSDKPAWPAAFARVTAVAAVGRKRQPAPFSNHGHWVDACTYGVFERSTYVTGTYPRKGADDLVFKAPVARWSGTSFAAPRFAAAVAAHMTEKGLDARAASADLLANGETVVGGFGVFVP